MQIYDILQFNKLGIGKLLCKNKKSLGNQAQIFFYSAPRERDV